MNYKFISLILTGLLIQGVLNGASTSGSSSSSSSISSSTESAPAKKIPPFLVLRQAAPRVSDKAEVSDSIVQNLKKTLPNVLCGLILEYAQCEKIYFKITQDELTQIPASNQTGQAVQHLMADASPKMFWGLRKPLFVGGRTSITIMCSNKASHFDGASGIVPRLFGGAEILLFVDNKNGNRETHYEQWRNIMIPACCTHPIAMGWHQEPLKNVLLDFDSGLNCDAAITDYDNTVTGGRTIEYCIYDRIEHQKDLELQDAAKRAGIAMELGMYEKLLQRSSSSSSQRPPLHLSGLSGSASSAGLTPAGAENFVSLTTGEGANRGSSTQS
jgi:hypothetical protein